MMTDEELLDKMIKTTKNSAFVLAYHCPEEPETQRLPKLKAQSKAGAQLPIEDVVTIMLNNTETALVILNLLAANYSYQQILDCGYTTTKLMSIVAIYNMAVSVVRIETEKAITLIKDQWDLYVSFAKYLETIPDVDPIAPAKINDIYVDPVMRKYVHDWYTAVKSNKEGQTTVAAK